MPRRTLVVGGAGHLGGLTCAALLRAGHEVRALDPLADGRRDVVDRLEATGVEVLRGDVADPGTRAHALEGVSALVGLAPTPAPSATEVTGEAGLLSDAHRAGVGRVVLVGVPPSDAGRGTASTTPRRPANGGAEPDEDELARLVGGGRPVALEPIRILLPETCGPAVPMRFDLPANALVRDAWSGRPPGVAAMGPSRPVVHVGEVARAVLALLDPAFDPGPEPVDLADGAERWSGAALREAAGAALVGESSGTGPAAPIALGGPLRLMPERTVRDGLAEVAEALSHGCWGDPWDPRHAGR